MHLWKQHKQTSKFWASWLWRWAVIGPLKCCVLAERGTWTLITGCLQRGAQIHGRRWSSCEFWSRISFSLSLRWPFGLWLDPRTRLPAKTLAFSRTFAEIQISSWHEIIHINTGIRETIDKLRSDGRTMLFSSVFCLLKTWLVQTVLLQLLSLKTVQFPIFVFFF